MSLKKYKVGILATHPIQYYVPWYQALAKHPQIDLEVFYCHRQTPQDQAQAGFGIPFSWDTPLLEGYKYQFLANRASRPNVYSFFGCDTPEIARIISQNPFAGFILQGWYVKSFWQALGACWHTHTPVFIRGDSQLLTQRSFIKRAGKYLFYRWFIPKFDAYLAVGKRNKQYYLHYGADPQAVFFVPHCVDNRFFALARSALAPQRSALRKGWGIPEESLVFLFVGKFISKKRPLDFLKALQKATERAAGIYGLMVGDGPLRADLEAFARKVNLAVSFSGFLNQKDISQAYTASDVLILPSDGRETWGLVVNESMASGLPAVVSDQVGCGPDLIQPAQTGEVFPCGDISRLAEVLVNFSLRRADLKNLGEKAVELVENYSIASAVEGTLKAIRTIADNKNQVMK